MSDLYAHGIDAHCGVDVPKPLEVLEESPRQTPVPIDDFPFPKVGLRWSQKLLERPDADSKESGGLIGAAAHRRRSTVKPVEARTNYGLLDELRRYSFMPLLDRTPENVRGALPPIRTGAEIPLREEGGRKQSSKELLQGILDRRPASNRPSRESSRKSLGYGLLGRQKRTEQKRSSGALSRVSCSEDQTPHICMDEQLTPLSGSEVAWFD
ncbi:hypothetical protein F4677DRAFT_441858 [Hypoxylon crocopeplum]|nr:hypothetical protein F4677DRAFT_441858 [Hypoxylon crocopeplum]